MEYQYSGKILYSVDYISRIRIRTGFLIFDPGCVLSAGLREGPDQLRGGLRRDARREGLQLAQDDAASAKRLLLGRGSEAAAS